MNTLLNTIIRFGITVSLSDRDLFIEKFSSFLEKYDAEPERAAKIAKILACCLEDLKENLTLHQVVKTELHKSDMVSKKDIDDINELLQSITKELKGETK